MRVVVSYDTLKGVEECKLGGFRGDLLSRQATILGVTVVSG